MPFSWLRKLFWQTVMWFRPGDGGHAQPSRTRDEEKPSKLEASPAPEVIEPPPPPPPQKKVARPRAPPRERDKWLHPARPPHKPSGEPRKPRKPRTVIELPQPSEEVLESDTRWDFGPKSEDTGVFYFRGALLDRLDHYFRAIARMKKADPNNYEIYSRIGGLMIPERSLAAAYALPSFWHSPKDRPAFGCIHFGCRNPEEEEATDSALQLLYFTKMKNPPPDVEPAPSADVYQISAYLDDLATKAKERIGKMKSKRWKSWFEKTGYCFNYWVAVDQNSKIRLLKVLQASKKHFDYRDGDRSHGGSKTRVARFSFSIPYRHWDYPNDVQWWFRERQEHLSSVRDNDKKKWNEMGGWMEDSIEEWACNTLCLIANFSQASEFAVRIAVEDERKHSAVFALDWKRTAYFFKDRDTVLTERGKTARIFHIVKPHIRTLKSGKESAVHLHFRGLRRFKWGKFNVHITVPGLHHMPVVEFNPGLSDVEAIPVEERSDMYDVREVVKRLAEHLDERKTQREIFK